MDYPFPVLKPRRRFSRGVLVGLTLLVTSFSVQGDTRSAVGSRAVGVCYCHCGMSKARSGCAKICETPKYASRWWATSCVRPRRKPPVDNPGASPRLPHPDRAEHAKL